MMKTPEEEDVIILENVFEINYYKHEHICVLCPFIWMHKYTTVPKLDFHLKQIMLSKTGQISNKPTMNIDLCKRSNRRKMVNALFVETGHVKDAQKCEVDLLWISNEVIAKGDIETETNKQKKYTSM